MRGETIFSICAGLFIGLFVGIPLGAGVCNSSWEHDAVIQKAGEYYKANPNSRREWTKFRWVGQKAED